jgi:hypothetical protein
LGGPFGPRQFFRAIKGGGQLGQLELSCRLLEPGEDVCRMLLGRQADASHKQVLRAHGVVPTKQNSLTFGKLQRAIGQQLWIVLGQRPLQETDVGVPFEGRIMPRVRKGQLRGHGGVADRIGGAGCNVCLGRQAGHIAGQSTDDGEQQEHSHGHLI